MNVLLDTHVLLWWVHNNPRLGKRAKTLIQADETLEPFEQTLPAEMERSGFRELAITFDHALAVRKLPLHHSDPFDRMLIAQARCEDLTLLTADPAITGYDVRTIDASA